MSEAPGALGQGEGRLFDGAGVAGLRVPLPHGLWFPSAPSFQLFSPSSVFSCFSPF